MSLRRGMTALLLAAATTLVTWAGPVLAAADEPSGYPLTVGTPYGNLYDVSPDGTATPFPGAGMAPSWAADGSRIAYRDATATEITVADPDGGNPQVIYTLPSDVPYGIRSASLSPHGDFVAFSAQLDDCGQVGSGFRGDALYVVEVATQQVREVTLPVYRHTIFGDIKQCRWIDEFDSGAAWSPDGTRIAVSTEDTQQYWDAVHAVGISYAGIHHDVVIVDVATGGETDLTFGVVSQYENHVYSMPAWSADDRIAFSANELVPNGTGSQGLAVMNSDGSNRHSVMNTEGVDGLPAWSPNSGQIAFMSGAGAEVINDDGSDRHLLYTTGEGIFDLSFHPPLAPPPSPDVTITDCSDQDALDAMTTITGNLVIDVSGPCDLTLTNLTWIDGGIVLTGDATLTSLALPALTRVGGDVDLSCNGTLTTFTAEELASVGGDVDVRDTSLTDVTAPTLTTIGGDLDVSGTTLTVIGLPEVTNVGGDVDVGGDATFTPACTGGPPTTVDGGPVTLDAPTLTVIGGDLNLETDAPHVDLGGTSVGGDIDISAGGNVVVIDTMTAGGSTDLRSSGGSAGMHVHLPSGAFDQPTPFTVNLTHDVDISDPVSGSIDGSPADITALTAYGFTFEVPALGQDATLSFTIDLSQLTDGLRSVIEDALDAGHLTLYTLTDEGHLTAFPVCVGSGTQGCATVTRADADHVQVDGLIGHFSSWGIALTDVLAAPTVTVDPTDATVDAGDAATFTSAATGDPQPTVQWQADDGSGWADLAGQTAATLSLTATAADDGSLYRAVWTNKVDSATSAAATLTVVSNRPPVAAAGGPYTAMEGGSVVLDATASTDADGDTLAFAWDLDGDGAYDDATGATPTVSAAQAALLADGPATASLGVRVTDTSGETSVATAGLSVTNVKPAAGVTPAAGSATVGTAYAVSLSATDASPVDATSGFLFAISWGDGSTTTTTSTSAAHVYDAVGTPQISVTATDKDGATSSAATAGVTVAVTPAGAALKPDVCAPSASSLVVTGTAGADSIAITSVKGGIKVSINGAVAGSFAPTGRVFVYAGGGNDTVTVDPALSRATAVFAGAGNDTINGDHGGGIYVGGPGDDTIIAGKSRDVLIGGTGADTLRAGQGDDVLIAGPTAHDDDVSLLCSASDRWQRTDLAYQARSDGLTSLLGAALGAGDDASRDVLDGDQGQDWFLAHLTGVAPLDSSNRDRSELLTQL